jgi:hypothetical protein
VGHVQKLKPIEKFDGEDGSASSNYPRPEPVLSNVKSRKENLDSFRGPEPASTGNGGIRKVAHPFVESESGKNKRQRTLVGSKAIDEEDDPRSSPSLRKISRGYAKKDLTEAERKTLGGIENI